MPRTPLCAAVIAGVLSVCTLVAVYGCQDRTPAQTARPSPADLRPAAPAASVERLDGAWWLVSPRGDAFFSLGVSVVDRGATRADYDPENPGYAAWRHYPDEAAWADATVARLRDWGFTTVGAWGDLGAIAKSKQNSIWFTPVLHVGSTTGAPWFDMWDPAIVARIDRVARDQILALRDDPRVIGYYTDNELGWWNATLFKMTLQHKPTSGQRRRLVALLREHYGNDWRRLREEFDVEGADGWGGLDRGGLLFIRPGGRGIGVMRRFLSIVAERYYQLTRDIIRKYDRRALILGDRYQSFYYPEVARAAAPYVDVISTNLNASWNDGTFPRFYLDTLHRIAGKPILVSEFYMAAEVNRSGNRNSHGDYPVAATQAQRAAGMRATLNGLLRLPYVVGAEWFQYYDEPRHGRYDGENFNFGLVDVNDRPYDEITAVTSALNPTAAKARPAVPRTDASHGIPAAPADPVARLAPNVGLIDWDRERGFVPPASEFPVADLYACWNPRAVYLAVYCLDIVEEDYYRDKRVPKEDRMQWVVRTDGRPDPIRARLGAGREAIVSDPAIRLWNPLSNESKTRNLAVIELPAALFGKERLSAGDEVGFSSSLRTHCGAYQVEWTGRFKLAP